MLLCPETLTVDSLFAEKRLVNPSRICVELRKKGVEYGLIRMCVLLPAVVLEHLLHEASSIRQAQGRLPSPGCGHVPCFISIAETTPGQASNHVTCTCTRCSTLPYLTHASWLS